MNLDALLLLFIVLCFSFVAYLFPATVASYRRHRNRGAILAANVFFGWSVLGWFGCLVWALTADVERFNTERSSL
jgi:hypothetical protein